MHVATGFDVPRLNVADGDPYMAVGTALWSQGGRGNSHMHAPRHVGTGFDVNRPDVASGNHLP